MRLLTPYRKIEMAIYDAAGTLIVVGNQGHRVAAVVEMIRRTNAHDDLVALTRRIAALNENAGEIGDGMLCSLVADARRILDDLGE